MPDSDAIDYQALMRVELVRWMPDVLRATIRTVLRRVAESGWPGNHHGYIRFNTRHAGVMMPDDLRRRYAESMVIVLQYQFSDLVVEEEHFSVTLLFSGRPERILVPFASILEYHDPAVPLQLVIPTSFDAAAETADDHPSGTGDGDEDVSASEDSAAAGLRAVPPPSNVVPFPPRSRPRSE